MIALLAVGTGDVTNVLTGPLGLAISLALIALLAGREIAVAAASPGNPPGWTRALNLAVPPLLLLFTVIVVTRFVMAV